MSKIFKPRRGKASTMNGTKSSTVLAAGEMFIELPDTGVGTGVCKMKMGDGVTAYGSLPYAMGGDIATTEITGNINDDTSTTATAALANVTTGKTLGSIIGSLRRACSLNAQAIATLNDEATQLNNWFKGQTINVTDYNDITTTGFYQLQTTNNTKNTPIASVPGRWYTAIIIRSINDEILQIVYSAEYASHLYRHRNSIGSWSAWVQVK